MGCANGETAERVAATWCVLHRNDDAPARLSVNAGGPVPAPMPVISRFFGIVIVMLYRDHEPAHFHATYGEFEVSVRIGDGGVTGRMPRRALEFLREWLELHRSELDANWERARLREPLLPIAPLE